MLRALCSIASGRPADGPTWLFCRTQNDGLIFAGDLHLCFLVIPREEDLLDKNQRAWEIIWNHFTNLSVGVHRAHKRGHAT